MAKIVQKKAKIEKSRLRNLSRLFSSRGIIIRRENLSRGPSFRVKSGNCHIIGTDHIFVDKRLPVGHQVSMLVDYLVDLKLDLTDQELSILSAQERKLLSGVSQH